MRNKVFKAGIITAAVFFALGQCSFAEIAMTLENTPKHKLEISEPVGEITDNLFESKEEMLKYYLQNQKKMDIEDIKILWESTVNRNPVIRFAIEKLSIPPEKRRLHSSRMTKTVATLIRGAAMVPGLLGSDPIISSASSLSGGLAGRYINNKSTPKDVPITDTELIQLARLVEDLQDKIIRNYYEYKGNLEAYKVALDNTIKAHSVYSDAFKTDGITEIITSNSIYNQAKRKESELKQKIKLNRIELERLAGADAIDNLNLGNATRLEKLKTEPDSSIEKKSSPDSKSEIASTDVTEECFDADVRDLASGIAFELKEEREELLGDLQILWAAAVENSETIRFAMMKLSNPDGEVEKATAVKKILSPIASVAPLVGLGLGDPVSAGTAMFSGNLLNSVMSDDSKINQYLTKVTDADLILLAQEADTLQEKLINLYHSYLSAIIDFKLINDIEKNDAMSMEVFKSTKPELACVADVFEAQMLGLKQQARQDVLTKRVALEQFVGNEALMIVDENISNRLGYKL